MTSGERAVWAAAYVAGLERGEHFTASATRAANAVSRLRRAIGAGDLDDEARAMLDDILSNGADR